MFTIPGLVTPGILEFFRGPTTGRRARVEIASRGCVFGCGFLRHTLLSIFFTTLRGIRFGDTQAMFSNMFLSWIDCTLAACTLVAGEARRLASSIHVASITTLPAVLLDTTN